MATHITFAGIDGTASLYGLPIKEQLLVEHHQIHFQ